MRDYIEAAVAYILPVCPFAKNKSVTSRGLKANISEITLKSKSNSVTGVDLRWHTKKEYAMLTSEQKKELYEWQKTKDGKAVIKNQRGNLGRPFNLSRKKLQGQVKALLGQIER